MFQRPIPFENVVPDCLRHSPIHGGKEPSYRIQSLGLFRQKVRESALSERGPLDILKLKEIASNFPFSSLDLLSLDEYWTQKYRMGLELALVRKRNKKKGPVTDEEER